VSSDGSTDRTNDIVSGIEDSRLVLRAFSERSGKTACLNRVVPHAKGDVVLFTDANSMLPSDLLVKLIRNFASPDVGVVTGWTKYRSHEGEDETTGVYSKLEMWTKHAESLISSCVGADGAIFAIRKPLYRPLEEHDINDFVIPLHVIRQGKRMVMDPEVFCYEEPSEEAGKEYRRQVRITTRTLGAISRNLEFMHPLRFGSFSLFLVSHKIVRFLVPFFLIGTFVTNLFLLNKSIFYIVTLSGQIVILLMGLFSIIGIYNGRLASVIKFFLITVSAQFVGWFRMLLGTSDTIWTPQR
jgi:cellulose synthase/poly-beta-1,6-N-acetylglucosamine synthase-like glycosyltransferase